MHAAKRRTLIFNSSLLVCRVTLRSPFFYFNVMTPLLILIKPKDYAAPQMSACGTSRTSGKSDLSLQSELKQTSITSPSQSRINEYTPWNQPFVARVASLRRFHRMPVTIRPAPRNTKTSRDSP